MSALSQFFTLRLSPGQIDSVNAEGTNFWIVFAPVPVQIMYPGGEFGIYEQGSGLDNLPNGETFKRLTVRNPSLGAIAVVIYVGGPLYRDSRLSIMEMRTRLAAWSDTQLLAAETATFNGVTPADGGNAGYIDLKRQSILVTNLDQLLNLEILDAAGTACGVIFPSKQIILPVSEGITIKNANGSAVSCFIAEIWSTSLII